MIDAHRRRLPVVGLVLFTLLAACRPPEPTATGSFSPLPVSTRIPTEDEKSARRLLGLPRAAGVWPGANGLSGVNGDPVLDAAHVEGFCAERGRPCRIAHSYTDRTSYTSMTAGSSWTFSNFATFAGALVISQGLVPTGGEAQMAPCAAGEFDSLWQDFGTLMVRQGRADSIIRLGWEFNE